MFNDVITALTTIVEEGMFQVVKDGQTLQFSGEAPRYDIYLTFTLTKHHLTLDLDAPYNECIGKGVITQEEKEMIEYLLKDTF